MQLTLTSKSIAPCGLLPKILITGLGGTEQSDWMRGSRVLGDFERIAAYEVMVVWSEERVNTWRGGE